MLPDGRGSRCADDVLELSLPEGGVIVLEKVLEAPGVTAEAISRCLVPHVRKCIKRLIVLQPQDPRTSTPSCGRSMLSLAKDLHGTFVIRRSACLLACSAVGTLTVTIAVHTPICKRLQDESK